MSTTEAVAEFYDQLAQVQDQIGINRRHLSILRQLIRFGLKKSDEVLEIGCGVGTLTELLAKAVSAGEILASDLSSESICWAQRRLAAHKNVRFVVGDAAVLQFDRTFDVIVLPDVLEHIPIASHPALFQRLDRCLKDDGFIFIHIPDPHYLRYIHRTQPQLLQIVDQPLDAACIVASLEGTQLAIEHLESYCIWTASPDYRIIVLRREGNSASYHDKRVPLWTRVKESVGSRWRRFRWANKRHR